MATRSWNRVELIGNLTRDPELRFTPSGAAVATFTIATNRTYVTDGEKREDVDYHRCVAWNKLAELCEQLLKKGNRVFVSGRLQNRSWETQDGQTKQITEIVVEDMLLLTNRSEFAPAGDDTFERVQAEFSVKPEPEPTGEAVTEPKEPAETTKSEPAPTEVQPQSEPTAKEKTKKSAEPEPKEDIDIDDLPF